MSPTTVPLPEDRPGDFKPTLNILWDKVHIPQADKAGGIPIADRYSLKGKSDYPTWCTVMRSHLGLQAAATALGTSLCPVDEPGLSAFLSWDQFALNCILVSINTDLVSLLDQCTTAAEAWTTLEQRFAPKDAQATLRVIKGFFPLHFAGGDLTSLDKSQQQYLAAVKELKALTIDLDTLCSAHLLCALPPSLGALETIISVKNPKKLPPVHEIFSLVRNELSRAASSGKDTAVGLVAAAASSKHKAKFKPNPAVKPPSPCKHCKGDHWNNLCPTKQVGSTPSAPWLLVLGRLLLPLLAHTCLSMQPCWTLVLLTTCLATGSCSRLSSPPLPWLWGGLVDQPMQLGLEPLLSS